jgi:thymidylate kinase
MGQVIVLMGIDGSGKSTLSRALQHELALRGVPAVARWATLRPVLLKPFITLAKFMLVRKAPKALNYEAHMQAKRSGMDKLRFAHAVYFFIMTLDYLPQVWWKVGLPRLLGRHVICDRYYQDLALDFAITINGDVPRMMRALRRLQHWVPATDLHYFVAVPPEVALARKDDVPSLSYLQERDRYYRAMATELRLPVLDGQATVADNCQRLMHDLKIKPT